jgi:hypothetical protein
MNLEIFNAKIEKIKGIEFGTRIDFDINSFPHIPEIIKSNRIKVHLRQRFTSFGLIDNVIISITKNDSIALGLWILGSYFQKKFDKYILQLDDDDSLIREIWIDCRPNMTADKKMILDNPVIDTTLKKFVWTAISVEDLVRSAPVDNNQKISLYVTNSEEDYFTMEQFYKRDILIGFGGIVGGCLAAEFFLNLGLDKSDVNYEYIKYEYLAQNLACESSCEARVELIHTEPFPKDKETTNFISENN